jgi:aconitate hydratase
VAEQALENNLEVKSEYTVTPGSEQVRYTVERDGLPGMFSKKLAVWCWQMPVGPCIGQWARHNADKGRRKTQSLLPLTGTLPNEMMVIQIPMVLLLLPK